MDNNFNVVGIIDWDSMRIVQDSDTDITSFEKLWDIYKNS